MNSSRAQCPANFTNAIVAIAGIEQILGELSSRSPDELLVLAKARTSERLVMAEVEPSPSD